MQIRTINDADTQPWWNLRREALRTQSYAFGMSTEEHEATSLEETAARLRENPETNFTLGAFEDDRLVGMATFVRETRLKLRHIGHIYGVYVAASHRHRGIANALITALLEKARRDHPSLEQITLAVTGNNGAASRLYRRLGFTSFGIEPKAIKIGVEYFDMEHMILRF
jgi:ribosomal protein S18 acetylase RimI-like enzyme